MRYSICPSDLGANPFTVETSNLEVQVDLITMGQLADRDEKIDKLSAELEERHKIIDELEKRLDSVRSKSIESDKVSKLQFDNQILMTRLSQYKKAEKAAKEIAQDYETMKQKYYNVMTENKDMKTQVFDLMQSNCDKEHELQQLKMDASEKRAVHEKYIVEIKQLRADKEK